MSLLLIYLLNVSILYPVYKNFGGTIIIRLIECVQIFKLCQRICELLVIVRL